MEFLLDHLEGDTSSLGVVIRNLRGHLGVFSLVAITHWTGPPENNPAEIKSGPKHERGQQAALGE
jgi:hypothetical protein